MDVGDTRVGDAGHHRRWWVAIGVWGVVVLGGMAALLTYEGAPGAVGEAAEVWPEEAPFALESRPTMVMFLHPECACSTATLSELERLLPEVRGRAAVHLVFSAPGKRLRTQAGRVEGAAIHEDEGAVLARRFGATTSGHAFVFDAAGIRVFSGGITAARGHEGRSDGGNAVRDALSGQSPEVDTTSVFGCPLYETIEAPDA